MWKIIEHHKVGNPKRNHSITRIGNSLIVLGGQKAHIQVFDVNKKSWKDLSKEVELNSLVPLLKEHNAAPIHINGDSCILIIEALSRKLLLFDVDKVCSKSSINKNSFLTKNFGDKKKLDKV